MKGMEGSICKNSRCGNHFHNLRMHVDHRGRGGQKKMLQCAFLWGLTNELVSKRELLLPRNLEHKKRGGCYSTVCKHGKKVMNNTRMEHFLSPVGIKI